VAGSKTTVRAHVTKDVSLFVSGPGALGGFVEFLEDGVNVAIHTDTHAELLALVRKVCERLGIPVRDPFEEDAPND
jgi:hypothetical protein